jgi:hypothetical protein
MADGCFKSINQIKRGDLIASDFSQKQIHKVSLVNRNPLFGDTLLDIIEILPNAFGLNQPNQRLLITPNHPIFYNFARRPAKCFDKFSGVIVHQKKMAKNILEKDNDADTYSLYDLQFDCDGSYVANNLQIQSRSPYSELTPLPKEFYFDQSLWTSELTWDCYDHELPLDTNQISPN